MLKALNCPNCGAPIQTESRECEYCNTRFVDLHAEARLLDLSANVNKVSFEMDVAQMSSVISQRLAHPYYTGGGGGGTGSSNSPCIIQYGSGGSGRNAHHK